MEPNAIQIVTTIALMVAAGAVALVCDYLRNRSQQLRELALELDVRKEMTAAPSPGARSAVTVAAARVARLSAMHQEEKPAAEYSPAILHGQTEASPNEAKPEQFERHSADIVRPALTSAAEMTSLRGNGRARRRAMPPPDVPLPRLDDMNPRQALSDWLDQRAAKAPAKYAEPVIEAPVVEARVQRPEPAIEVRVIEAPIMEAPIESPEPLPASEATPAVIVAAPEAQPEPQVEPVAMAEPPVAEPVAAETVIAAPQVSESIAEATPAAEKDELRLIIRRALAKRNQQTAASSPQPVQEPAAVAPPTPEPVFASAVAAPVAQEEVVQEVVLQEPQPERVAAPVPVAGQASHKLSLFLSTRKIDAPATPTAPPPRFEVIEGSGNSGHSQEVTLPAGLHDHVALERALSTGKPFTGLAISVGVNDAEGRASRNGDLMQSIAYFIRGLLEETEFACRANEDEFLILCPGLEGGAAQSRLNRVAEQLWDYQLRGVSTWSILFSWGGADVHLKRLSEVITMATEQMCQTRRGRKMVSVDSIRPLQRAAM